MSADVLRILFVVPALGPGGSERVLINLLSRLDQSRFECHVASLQVDCKRTPPADVAVHEINIRNLPGHVTVHSLGVRRARFATPAVVRLCHRLQPDAVFAMSSHMSSAVLAARPLLPPRLAVVVREGTNIAAHEPNRLLRYCYRWLYRSADAVVCQSDSMKEQLARALDVPQEKIVRLYNPVDIALISELAERSPSPFRGLGPHLVWVGRLSSEKGIDVLLRLVLVVRQQLHGVKLTIVGCGVAEAELHALRTELDLGESVDIRGWQTNPYPFLKHADVLVLSSRYEGFPNVALEALALGTAVVTTNSCGGLQEIAETTSRMRIVSQNTPESLAAGILATLKEGGNRKAKLEPAFVNAFSIDNTISAYERLLTTCTKRAQPIAQNAVIAVK